MTTLTPVEEFNALLSETSVLFVVCKLAFCSYRATFYSRGSTVLLYMTVPSCSS